MLALACHPVLHKGNVAPWGVIAMAIKDVLRGKKKKEESVSIHTELLQSVAFNHSLTSLYFIIFKL